MTLGVAGVVGIGRADGAGCVTDTAGWVCVGEEAERRRSGEDVEREWRRTGTVIRPEGAEGWERR